MNLIPDAISPNTFAKGTHSNIEISRNIIINGISRPPPPKPAAFASNVIRNTIRIPTYSLKLNGNTNSFFIKTAALDVSLAIVVEFKVV